MKICLFQIIFNCEKSASTLTLWEWLLVQKVKIAMNYLKGVHPPPTPPPPPPDCHVSHEIISITQCHAEEGKPYMLAHYCSGSVVRWNVTVYI